MKRKDKKIIKSLGKCLKQLREEKDISLNTFACESKITSATLSRVENGLVDTRFSTLLQYARALEIPLEDILVKLEIDYTKY